MSTTTTPAVTNIRLIKSPDAWYSNTILLYVLRVVQFMPVITTLGLLGYVMDETSAHNYIILQFGISASAISLFYLLVIVIVRVPANVSAMAVPAVEVAMAIMWLGAFISLFVYTDLTNCKWAYIPASTRYSFSGYDLRSPCRARQASIGTTGLAFVLFTCSSVLCGLNVVSPIRAAFGSTLEGPDATAQLIRGCNLAIDNRSEGQTDIETGVATASGESTAAPVGTEPVAVETAVETTATESVVVEPTVLSETNK